MLNKTSIGRDAEKLAAKYLLDKGYVLLKANYRFKKSEIDLIARYGNLTVFVEVKVRKNNSFGFPEQFLTDAQIERIHIAAQAYQSEEKMFGPIRFDFVAITGQNIEHFTDAF